MALPEKLRWPAFPFDMDRDISQYLTIMQEQMEEYLRDLSRDLKEVSFEDVGLQDKWNENTNVHYDQDGLLYFVVGGVTVCWFDWAGNWFRKVNFDNLTTNLAKTKTNALYAYDNGTETIDIFHNDAQVLQISNGEIIIDNQFAFKTGKTLDSATSLKWIDEGLDADGDLTTFISVKQHRVLEIKGTDVRIKGAIKVA